MIELGPNLEIRMADDETWAPYHLHDNETFFISRETGCRKCKENLSKETENFITFYYRLQQL